MSLSTVKSGAVLRPMRIIALPLTRPRRTVTAPAPEKNGETSAALTYYHFQLTRKRASSTGGVVNWVSSKAAGVWANFGKAPEGSWKRRIFGYGERLVDRIDFEELALKGVDPALGPSILRRSAPGPGAEAEGKQQPRLTIPLVYPARTVGGTAALEQLRTLLERRVPIHRRGFWVWMAVAPLTLPFIVIPVIPNLPFFFCAWRSWSHYRAYRASTYLGGLVEHGCVVPESDEELGAVFALHGGVLTRAGVGEVVRVLCLDRSAEGEMVRAVEQARVRPVST